MSPGTLTYTILSTLFIIVLYSCTNEPIKIGMVTTLSGLSSSMGINTRNAAILAIDKVNRQGGIDGRPVELIIKDDKADPELALLACNELIEEGVTAILGPYISTVTMKTVPLMNQKGVLMISTGSSTAELSGLDDNLLRLLVPVDKKTPYLAELAYRRKEIKKIAIIYELTNRSYTGELFLNFKKDYEKLGGEIVKVVTYSSGDDFKASDIIAQSRLVGAEGVFIIGNGIETAILCQHLRKNRFSGPIIASGWALTDPDLITNGGSSIELVSGIEEFNYEATTPRFLNYKNSFEQRFSEKIGRADIISYEATELLISALAESDDWNRLKETILTKKGFRALDNEVILFDKFGDPQRTLYVVEINRGAIKTVDKIEPESF